VNNVNSYRHYGGIAALDRNTLIIEAYRFGPMLTNTLATSNTRDYICELDITPGLGNNLSFDNNLTPMFRLPAPGDPEFTGTNPAAIVNGFYFVDNTIVITGRHNQSYAQTNPKYFLQYVYTQSVAPDLYLSPQILFNIPIEVQQGVSRYPITFNGLIRFAARTNLAPTGGPWSAVFVNQSPPYAPLMSGAAYPQPAGFVGPEGASVNTDATSIPICNSIVFIP
jgi:hypothetical protein